MVQIIPAVHEISRSAIYPTDTTTKDVELAVSDSSRCRFCQEIIPFNTPRIFYFYNIKKEEIGADLKKREYWEKAKHFGCYKCAKGIFADEISKKRTELFDLLKVKQKYDMLMQNEKVISIIKDNEILKELGKEGDNKNGEKY